MKIGIGITTTPNRDIIKQTYKEWVSFLPDDAKLIIENDVDFTGVAASKNRLLAKLDDCEHIFLVDDDVIPLIKGWELRYIDHPEPHLMYNFKLKNKPATDMQEVYRDEVTVAYTHTRGCFIYLRRSVLDVVGGFDEEYGTYYEHPDLTNRIHNAGLTTHRSMDVVDSDKLLYCYDQDASIETSIPKKVKPNHALYRKNRQSSDFKAYK